jgi:hypothetical protein
MMGLQTAIKATTKRKYEIETDCEKHDKKGESPPKALKFSEVLTSSLTTTTSTTLNSINKSNNIVLKSIKSDIIPPETHQWSNEPLDSISKLQAVTETWSNSTLSSAPFNCTTNTLSSLAQTAENITRSTLATTLLDQDDLLDDDEDDFQDDFDFDDDDDDDLLLDDRTILVNHNYTPIRYPSSPSPTRQNYIPAYPKPGYTPESYQNCSRTPTLAQYSNHHGQPNPRSSFFQGTNQGTNWTYYNHHHQQHYDLASHQQQQQTIRCAENGKSYFELGSSSSYCTSNRSCNNGIGMLKNCCEGRNNLWCTTKQCYKEKRLKMMNLSMFKLARFRQASDQSLYRSVLICNTLKSLEKEIELENQIFHQRMQQHRQAAIHNQNQLSSTPQQNIEYVNQAYPSRSLNCSETKQNSVGNNNLSNERSMINNCSLNACNSSFSQPYNNSTTSNNCISNRIPTFNEAMPIYEHHPLKDPSSGRATPFPSTLSPPGTSQSASNSSSVNSTNDTDSAFGDVDDVDCNSTKPIDWGSVLSLSSQSALDPLSNDIFTSTTSTSLTQTSASQQNSNTITNLHVKISNSFPSTSSSSNSTATSNISTPSMSLSTIPSSTNAAPISSIITTLTTVSSCSLESLTASSISVSQSVSNTNWDFPFLETSESSNNSEYYELNCYKLSSALNQMDDFVKSEQLTPVSSSAPDQMEQSHHQINIMVGS